MIIEEVPFKVFLERNPHLKSRPINEQAYHYNDYLTKCKMVLYYNLECGGQGASSTSTGDGGGPITDTYFILQENADYLLQEDGDKLIWAI